MAHYYVKDKENKWNIFSSVIDNFLFDSFIDFETLKAGVIDETVREKDKELETLLTDKPELNVMSYEEAIEIIKEVYKGG